MPARSATQSGQGKDKWMLEYEPEKPREIEPLMGWTSSARHEVAGAGSTFDTKEEAIAYAERNGIPYRVEEPKPVDAQDPVLFRQFHAQPRRSLVALTRQRRRVQPRFDSVAQLDRAAAF